MKIAVLEKMRLGFDVDISYFEEFGEVMYYDNTSVAQISERIADVDFIIANKAPLKKRSAQYSLKPCIKTMFLSSKA